MSVEKRNNKWIARIQINNKRIYLGSFKLKREAVEAYNLAKEINKADKEVEKSLWVAEQAIYEGNDLLEKSDEHNMTKWQYFKKHIRTFLDRE